MGLAINGKKEQWLLNRVADGEYSADDYLSLFPNDDLIRGEWSPRYMWLLQTAGAAPTCLPASSTILVSLRDPVERYASHQRFSALRRAADPQPRWKPAVSGGLGAFAGLYADQLEPWRAAVGQERIVITVYEAAALDPDAACTAIWKHLGLEEVCRLTDPSRPSSTVSTGADWEWPPGLRQTLVDLYTPQVRRLQDVWGLDTSLWSNFSHLA